MLFQTGFGLDEVDLFNRLEGEEIPNETGRNNHIFEVIDLGFEAWTNSFRGTRYN